MKINKCLIVEDDNVKCSDIIGFINELYRDIRIDRKSSLNSGMVEMSTNEYDLILLDMSLPLFEGKKNIYFNPYGGIEFLEEMEQIGNETPVVVVTQFSIFGEGKNEKNFEELKKHCLTAFKNCMGVVYFFNYSWKEELRNIMES